MLEPSAFAFLRCPQSFPFVASFVAFCGGKPLFGAPHPSPPPLPLPPPGSLPSPPPPLGLLSPPDTNTPPPPPIPPLRDCWLEHHEQVLRSSVQPIQRYRTATEHLLRFLQRRPVRHAAHFHAAHAEEFVRYLRAAQVSPNGHAHTATRPLMDKGL